MVDLNMHPVNQPQVYVSRASQAFDKDMKLTDETMRKQLAKLMVALAEWAEKLRLD